MPNRTVTCGDCIHADICKQLNGGWFSRENIAYCKAFKDRTNVAEVVRCKDCKHYVWDEFDGCHVCLQLSKYVKKDFFCSYGERKDNG